MSDVDFVIIKRGLFYRPNRQGYTGIREQAGRYTEDEARDHALNGECSFMPLDQAPEFLPAAHNDIVVKHLTNQRDTALTRMRELEQKPRALKVCDIEAELRKHLRIGGHDAWEGHYYRIIGIPEAAEAIAALSSKDQEKTNG